MSSIMDDQILPVRLVDERNPIKDLEIDFETVDKFFKLIIKVFPDDDAMRKQIETLVSVADMQFKEDHYSLETGIMVWRSMLILLSLEQFYDWSWNHLFDTILQNISEVVKKFPRENVFSDFLRLTLSKERFLPIIQKI